MNNLFESHGRLYSIDRFGVINQEDAKPFHYNQDYISVYDTEAYQRQEELLQGLRLGFTLAAHGEPITSLLDYGYGNGAFMKFAKQQVEHVLGYDLTGVHVDGCYIMPHLVKSDVFTFWDALEHVQDLSFVRDLPCRTIIISLPYCHFFTMGREWFDKEYKHRKPDEHLHHFNSFSLANIMNYYGWRQIAVSTHEDIVRKSLHGMSNILTMAFKRL